jgi:Holliday junction resolvase RusA-like endonuclease
MSKFWKKVKCAAKEVFNFLTNLICPVLSLVCALMEVFQLPTKAIQAVKKAEYWCWKAAGTKDDIDNFLDKVEDAIEKTEEGSDIL